MGNKNVPFKFRGGKEEERIVDKIMEEDGYDNKSELFRDLLKEAGENKLTDVDVGFFDGGGSDTHIVKGEHKMFKVLRENLKKPGDEVKVKFLEESGLLKFGKFKLEVMEEKE